MTREELTKKSRGGTGNLMHTILVTNPVLLPEDTPAEVKCAWIRFYNQGRKDAITIKAWLDIPVPEAETEAKLLRLLQAVPASYIHG